MENNNTASAFKWRITNAKYIYITDEGTYAEIGGTQHIGSPFIYDMSGDTRIYPASYTGQTYEGQPDETFIKRSTTILSKEDYRILFEIMTRLLAEDPDGAYLQLLDYEAYFQNVEACSEDATGVTCRPIDIFLDPVTNTYQSGTEAEVIVTSVIDETYPEGGIKRTFELTFGIPEGRKGDQGIQGIQGTRGIQGTQGPRGTRGMQGTQGPQGIQGTQGPQGPAGGESAGNTSLGTSYDLMGYNSDETPSIRKANNVQFKNTAEEVSQELVYTFTLDCDNNTKLTIYVLTVQLNSGIQVTSDITIAPGVYDFVYSFTQEVAAYIARTYSNYYVFKNETPQKYEFHIQQNNVDYTIGVATMADSTAQFVARLNEIDTIIRNDGEPDISSTIEINPYGTAPVLVYTNPGGSLVTVQGHVSNQGLRRLQENLVTSTDLKIGDNFRNIKIKNGNSVIEVASGALNIGSGRGTSEIILGARTATINTTGPTANVNINTRNLNIAGKTTVNGDIKCAGSATATVNSVSDVLLGCPVGSIMMWAGTKAPYGWLLCNGYYIFIETPTSPPANSYIGEEYTNLCNLLEEDGWKYGTHKLPNLEQRFPLGASTLAFGPNNYNVNLGRSGGEAGHKLTLSEMPRHNHYLYKSYTGSGSVEAPCQAVLVNGSDKRNDPNSIYSRYTGGTSTSETQADGTAHNNIPPYVALNFIIKYM